MKILKISCATEEHANQSLQNAIPGELYLGNLWAQPGKEPHSLKVIQRYKLLKFRHIPASCSVKNEICSTCAGERHAHKNCKKKEEVPKCRKCYASPYAPQSKKLAELCERKQVQVANLLLYKEEKMVARGTESECRSQNQVRTVNVNTNGISNQASEAFLSYIHEKSHKKVRNM